MEKDCNGRYNRNGDWVSENWRASGETTRIESKNPPSCPYFGNDYEKTCRNFPKLHNDTTVYLATCRFAEQTNALIAKPNTPPPSIEDVTRHMAVERRMRTLKNLQMVHSVISAT